MPVVRRATPTVVVLLAAICATLAIGTPASGRRVGSDRVGDFDFYVFALSVAPSFCELTGYRKHKAQCESPSDPDFRDTPLTIHGLWPNKRRVAARDQPQSCSVLPLIDASEDLSRELRRYMPGIVDGLAQYEWSKHGVCSGLPPDVYFHTLIALAKAANETIGAVMKERGLFGREIEVSELVDAVAANYPELADALVVDCQFARAPRGGGRSRAYVGEIRVLIAKDLADAKTGPWPASFVSRAAVGYGANSGCPRGTGFLPSGYHD